MTLRWLHVLSGPGQKAYDKNNKKDNALQCEYNNVPPILITVCCRGIRLLLGTR